MSKRKLTETEANILISELAENDLANITYDDLKSRFLRESINNYQMLTDDDLIDEYINRHGALPFDTEG